MNTRLAGVSLLALLMASCGGPPRLVVGLGEPIALTDERSTGFDDDYSHDVTDAVFWGQRLATPTVFAEYEGVEVWSGGRRIWVHEGRTRGSVGVIDGVVFEVELILDPVVGITEAQRLGERVTAGFDAWAERNPAYWPYLVRNLGAYNNDDKVIGGGTFREAGVTSHVAVHRWSAPEGPTFRLDVEFRLPAPKASGWRRRP